MERKYTVMHRWADGYTASRHGGSARWTPLAEGIGYTEACDEVLNRIAMEDGSPCETMREAYRGGLASRLRKETRFSYDCELYSIVATRNVKSWLVDENYNERL